MINQKNYVYQLTCELFRYEDELIDTNIDEIDELIGGNDSTDSDKVPVGNVVNLTMIGIGVTATATCSIVNGGVRFITVTNRGGGYTTTPIVGISSAPSGGKTASAIAKMIGGIVACNSNVNPKAQSVQSVEIINAGYGYTVAPQVRFIEGGGKGATGIASIGDGIVGVITVTNAGSGYITPPTITFTGVSTVSAAATAVVSAAGTITSIRITNAGLGYTISPTITIANPALTSSGNFVFNEIVTGSQSGVTARVKSWNSTTNVLQVSNINGEFKLGENIVGSASSASHYLRTIDAFPARDGYAANEEIEEEANDIIDFDETNPFGTP